MATATPAARNTPTLDDYLKRAIDLGAQSGAGDDSIDKFLLQIHEAGYLNVIDLERNKHGKDVDDVTKMVSAFYESRKQNSIFKVKSRKTLKKVSTWGRSAVRLSRFSKGGPNEPLTTVNNFADHFRKMADNKEFAGNMKGFGDAFYDMAREQVKREHMIDQSEFQGFILRKPKGEVTEEDKLERMRNTIKNDKQIEAATIIELNKVITRRLVAIAKAKAPNAA